jgi:hypothetical protein
MTPKLPGLLVRHIQQKRCVVFVGAGLSAGAGLPVWSKLLLNGINELVGALPEGELHQAELTRLVEQGKLLEVADFCKEKLGSAFHQFLSEQVRGDQAKKLPPTHDILMRLPFSAWVTTNYDKLLERAYSQVNGGGFPKTLTHKDTDALGRLLFDGGPFILKAHGDIDRPETVVLTSRDYSDIIHANPAFNESFSALLLTKALLFVGYSLSDPDFRLLMDRQLTHFKGFVPERFALMTGVGPVERDVLWRTARIQVIPYENASKIHAEVLQFLQALEAELLSRSALESVQLKVSVPGPAPLPQAAQIVSHNLSTAARPRSPSAGSRVLESLMQEAEPVVPTAPIAPVAPSGAPLRGPSSPPPHPVSASPHQLFIQSMGKRIQLGWIHGGEAPWVQELGPETLNAAVLLLEKAQEGGALFHPQLYPQVVEFFEKHLPREFLGVLKQQGSSEQVPLVLHPAPELQRFPWELLPSGGQPISLKRKLIREPIGVPAQVRGAARLRASPHIVLVEGRGAIGGDGPREVELLARLYEGVPGLSCKVLLGPQATFHRIVSELIDQMPDLLHYTGDVGQRNGELCLLLPGGDEIEAEALNSVLNVTSMPFLVMNAPCSAFAPYAFGVYPTEQGYLRLPAPPSRIALLDGRKGFMELATQTGVGAFVGAFDMPGRKAGTTFMVALHRALLTGFPIAEAVFRARQETHQQFPNDPTALQYVLSGDGTLQLVNSQREGSSG